MRNIDIKGMFMIKSKKEGLKEILKKYEFMMYNKLKNHILLVSRNVKRMNKQNATNSI